MTRFSFPNLESEWGFEIQSDGYEYFTDMISGDEGTLLTESSLRKFLINCDFRTIPPACLSVCPIPTEPNQRMVVQLIKAVDVSKPNGPEAEDENPDTDDEPTQNSKHKFKNPKRLLRLTFVSMCGLSKFEALEIHRIPTISDELVPGSKFLLKGPLNSQGGFLLLKSAEHIEPVGGRVNRLAESWKLNKDVKARRHGDRSGNAPPGGPPKFVSFMDFRKHHKQAESVKQADKTEDQAKQDGTEKGESRSLKVEVGISEKMKELQSSKLAYDAFAMRQRAGGKGDRRSHRLSKRERDAELEQYKPPSRTAPQLAAFVKFDSKMDIFEAQMLSDATKAFEPSRQEQPSHRGKGQGKGRKQQDHRDSSGKGKGSRNAGKGKGMKGYRS